MGGEHALAWAWEEGGRSGAWAVEVESNGDDDSQAMTSDHTLQPPPLSVEGAGLQLEACVGCKCTVRVLS